MEHYGNKCWLRELVNTGKLKNLQLLSFKPDVICMPIKQFVLENNKYLIFEQLLYLYKVLHFNS